MARKVYAITNGCPENQNDTALMQELLKRNGWRIAECLDEASLVLVNVCGLTNAAEEYSLDLIKRLQQQKPPPAELVVCGCLPKINSKRLRQVYNGVTFGSDEIDALCSYAGIENGPADISVNYLLPHKKEVFKAENKRPKNHKLRSILDPYAYIRKMTVPLNRFLEDKTSRMRPNDYYIKISTGCLNYCSYCAVKLSRGDVKSKSIEQIVSEFDSGLKKGHKEFALIGTDVGSYGRDIGVDLAHLLKELVSRKGEFIIKTRNLNPRFFIEMLPDLEASFKSKKIVHISSAAQSGSNRILSLMNRKYRIEDYQYAVRSVQKKFPHIHFRTQLMVGFPGETEEDFHKTLKLLDSIFFDSIELYKYSPRPGTKAASLDNRLPEAIIKKRYNKLYVRAMINMTKKRFLHNSGHWAQLFGHTGHHAKLSVNW